MKKLLALLLLFGIVGCQTSPEFYDLRNTSLGCNNIETPRPGGCRHMSHSVKSEFRDVEIESDYSLVAYPKAEAINLQTGQKFHFGHSVFPARCMPGNKAYKEYCPKISVLKHCKNFYGSKCVLSKFNDETFYTSLDDYKNKEVKRKNYIAKAQIKSIKDLKKLRQQEKEKEEQKKLAVIHALKERCISYGFTGNNNIAACVQREANHDFEIEQQKYQVELLRQQLATQNNQTIVSEDIPWWLEILGAVAEGAAEGYKQAALINAMDSRYEKKSIYRYCRPGGLNYVGC